MVETLIILGIALTFSNWLTERFKLIGPLVLIAMGVFVSYIPHIPHITVDPEIILSVFLPILLYWEALNISLRGIKQALRGVILNGTLMVIFVAVAVGFIGNWMGLTLGSALLIGAALGPTDATAVVSMGKGISRRQMIVLRAESLINDGTALVVFALALAYTAEGANISASNAILRFLISFVGGGITGFIVGWVSIGVEKYIDSPMLTNVFRIIIPFISYFFAEQIEASGVLAVVVTGLYMAQATPRLIDMRSRVLSRPVWGVSTYILNSLLFLLVGLLLPRIIRGLASDTLLHAGLVSVVIYVVMFVSRYLCSELIIRLIRLLDRRPSQKLRRTTIGERMVITVAGFRGAISLAVALSIPENLANGEPFPYRDLIIFVTSGVVILSLIVQGVLLPIVVRWVNRHPNPLTVEMERKDDEEINLALIQSSDILLENLPRLSKEQHVPQEVVARVQAEIETRRASWMSNVCENFSGEEAKAREAEERLRLETTRLARQNMIRFRDEGKIDEEALIYLLDLLDVEELRLTGPIEMG